MDALPHTSYVMPVSNILPSECGKRSLDPLNLEDGQVARVVGGYEVPKGSYPWQVRSCNMTTSSPSLCSEILMYCFTVETLSPSKMGF
jgi:hypothetical protein